MPIRSTLGGMLKAEIEQGDHMGSVVALTPRATETVDFVAQAAEAIEFLNAKAGKRFPVYLGSGELSKSSTMVLRLLRDGHELDDIKSVIAMKCREWKGQPRMRPYLRPKTLFGPENFEQYVGELEA